MSRLTKRFSFVTQTRTRGGEGAGRASPLDPIGNPPTGTSLQFCQLTDIVRVANFCIVLYVGYNNL